MRHFERINYFYVEWRTYHDYDDVSHPPPGWRPWWGVVADNYQRCPEALKELNEWYHKGRHDEARMAAARSHSLRFFSWARSAIRSFKLS
jgi:hypothetical protein